MVDCVIQYTNNTVMSWKRYHAFESTLSYDSDTNSKIMEHIKSVMNMGVKGATLSKVRYYAIMEYISTVLPESELEQVRTNFHTVMKFHPDATNVKKSQYMKDRYERLKQEGVSTYIITGQRDTYYRNKALLAAARGRK
jgi:hypothetical protein